MTKPFKQLREKMSTKSKKRAKAKTNEMMMTIPTCHRIDFDKVETIEDVKAILKAIEVIVYDDNDHWNEVKHLMTDIVD